MQFIIDLEQIKLKGLTLQQYVTLFNLFVRKTNPKEYEIFINNFGLLSINTVKELEVLKYIKIPDINEPGQYELRELTYQLLEGNKDSFLTWLNTFPLKTPSGRYLSPLRGEGAGVDKIRKKWKSLFKNDELLKQKVIKVLEAEIDWRKKGNKMEFMHNCETWLNQRDWEKNEHLLLSFVKTETKKFEDFL